jgi:hypothetical protein
MCLSLLDSAVERASRGAEDDMEGLVLDYKRFVMGLCRSVKQREMEATVKALVRRWVFPRSLMYIHRYNIYVCMYMYIYICILCMYIYINVCMYMYIYICIIYMYIYIYMNVCVYVYICVCVCVYIYIYMYIYMYVCMYVCMYVYTRIREAA